MKKHLLIIICTALCAAASLHAQVTIGSNENPHPDALLDLKNHAVEDTLSSKGLLLPRVKLTAPYNAGPLAAHTAGMTVYNKTKNDSVSPGYYYNDGKHWVRLPDNAWLTTGNAGTNPAYNFLGTTDNTALNFRTKNTTKMTILPNGNVGINTTNPSAELHVKSKRSNIGVINLEADIYKDAAPDGYLLINMQQKDDRNSDSTYKWTIYAGGPNGGYGVLPLGFEIWEYPDRYDAASSADNCCRQRFVIENSVEYASKWDSPPVTIKSNGYVHARNIRLFDINTNTSTVPADKVVVADAEGLLKTKPANSLISDNFILHNRGGVPSSSADPSGEDGEIRYDGSYIYIKTGGSWKRAALSGF